MSLFLLLSFFGLSMLGIPLAVALALAGVATLWLYTSMPVDLLSQTMFSSMNSFLLVAVPLFILVGTVMERGRVAERIFDFAEAIVGWLPGGLGHVNVISSVIFSGVSGSSVADIASVGAIEIKAMERHGFPKGYAVGMTLCTATLSSIIPPSILVVIAGRPGASARILRRARRDETRIRQRLPRGAAARCGGDRSDEGKEPDPRDLHVLHASMR